jgi:hypothetical protein
MAGMVEPKGLSASRLSEVKHTVSSIKIDGQREDPTLLEPIFCCSGPLLDSLSNPMKGLQHSISHFLSAFEALLNLLVQEALAFHIIERIGVALTV